MSPVAPSAVRLDGRSLDLEGLVAVARGRARVEVAPEAMLRVARCRAVVDLLLDHGPPVYGLTTGFGRLRDVTIQPEEAALLQENLVRSHACGVGRPFPEDVVRAALCLRANTLALGHSGVRPEVVETLLALLNEGLYPHVPSQGSVGASGDLAPLAHLALVVTGDPAARVHDPARRRSSEPWVAEPREEDFVPLAELVAAGRTGAFRPLRLQAREGLALVNGTQFMAALLALAVHDGGGALRAAETAAAMSHEAQQAVDFALRDEIHRARDLPHQRAVAARIRGMLDGSGIVPCSLNTARLRRAERALEEAEEHMARCGGTVRLVQERTRGLAGRVRRLRESAVHGPPAPTTPPPREPEPAVRAELRAWAEALRPLRAELAGLCLEAAEVAGDVDAGAEDLRKASAALALALRHLEAAVPTAPPFQEDYSFRCTPQVLACAHTALDHADGLLAVEMNAATDNPLLFPPDPPRPDMDAAAYRAWLEERGPGGGLTPAGRARLLQCWEGVLGGGNFHGQPLAAAADHLALALTAAASIAERRIAHLVDEATSNGLPPFLIEATGLHSGFMIPQYTAAALVSESKVLSHPASVDSIPTSANAEDHVSMGTHAARKCTQVVEHLLWVVAVEVLAAHQGIHFRQPLAPSPAVAAVRGLLEEHGLLPREREERDFHAELKTVHRLLREGRIPPEG